MQYKKKCICSINSPLSRWLLAVGTCLIASFSPWASADGFFLPNTLPYSTSSSQLDHIRGLSNEELLLQADMLRSNEMSAEHRVLNHQWLSFQCGESDPVLGGKVFSHIAKKALREYWRNERHKMGSNRLLPDENGELKTEFNDIDYDVRISSDSLTFGFQFEFN